MFLRMMSASTLLRPKRFSGLKKQGQDQGDGMIPTGYSTSILNNKTTGETASKSDTGGKGFVVGGQFFNVEHPLAGMKGTKWENYPKINAPTAIGGGEEDEEGIAGGSLLQKSFKKVVG